MATAQRQAVKCRIRAAVFCHASTANGRQTASTAMGKAATAEYWIAWATSQAWLWRDNPAAKQAACTKPPAHQRSAHTAKPMLTSGVPGSLAARSVSTSSRTVISSPVV